MQSPCGVMSVVGGLCILCSVCPLVPSKAGCDDPMFSLGADFCVLFAYFPCPDLCVDRFISLVQSIVCTAVLYIFAAPDVLQVRVFQ